MGWVGIVCDGRARRDEPYRQTKKDFDGRVSRVDRYQPEIIGLFGSSTLRCCQYVKIRLFKRHYRTKLSRIIKTFLLENVSVKYNMYVNIYVGISSAQNSGFATGSGVVTAGLNLLTGQAFAAESEGMSNDGASLFNKASFSNEGTHFNVKW